MSKLYPSYFSNRIRALWLFRLEVGRIKLMVLLFFLNINATATFAVVSIKENQLGYPPEAQKRIVISSDSDIAGTEFVLQNEFGDTLITGKIGESAGSWLHSVFNYSVALDSFQTIGNYDFVQSGRTLGSFNIGEAVYDLLPAKILEFFRIQRCGNTDPRYHSPCHTLDASQIVTGPDSGKVVDVTGGWHDAGDYIKFLNTTAYTTYFLLLSYKYFPELFEKKQGKFPAILMEARVGLDWLKKMNYAEDKLLLQVQDLRDHTVGWRLPEDDILALERPAYDGTVKTSCGIFSATMALAADVFKSYDRAYATDCLKRSKSLFMLGMSDIPEIQNGPDTMYVDRDSNDNLGLAAAELFLLTEDSLYLEKADSLLALNASYWISWGDLDNIARCRIAAYSENATNVLEGVLANFDSLATLNPYNYPLESFPWGSLTVQMGIASIAILYGESTGVDEYEDLAQSQFDFLLGVNPDGYSFIGGIGSRYPINFHHQISFLLGFNLEGAVAEGYVASKLYENTSISLTAETVKYLEMGYPAVYNDERADYLSNEPTIANNAVTLFVACWFAEKY
ncbi:glycoside hydrolase family 9 protein [bacterium]|nr:glycoside hydrolase family 9 protein [bacterium]